MKIRQKPNRFPLFQTVGDKVYKHIKTLDEGSIDPEGRWVEIPPKGRRREIIGEHHDTPMTGHGGIYKTFNRVRRKYFWPRMKVDIARYVQNCVTCQKYKPEPKAKIGRLLEHPHVDFPWRTICMDFMGPFPRSSLGNAYVLVVVDCFTKFVRLFPVRKANAQTVSKILRKEIFLLFGVPETIICDNGKHFANNIIKALATEFGVKLKYTPVYHPQADPAERVVRVVKTMISCFVGENQKKWDGHIDEIGCAIRTNVHEGTGQTPYFLNFGRQQTINGREYSQEQRIGNLQESVPPKDMKKIFAKVKERLGKMFKKNRLRYDLRRRAIMFNRGDQVLRRNYVQSDATKGFSAKLAPKYVGPFRVKNKISPWSYVLEDEAGREVGTWHAKDLKKFEVREDDTKINDRTD